VPVAAAAEPAPAEPEPAQAVAPEVVPVAAAAEPAPAEPAAAQAAASPWDGEVHAGGESLEAGDALMAALHFAVALRMSPEAAQAVIDGIGQRTDLALELVRGDALRLLGQESDAGQAYASVASRLGRTEPAAPEPASEPAVAPATPEPAAAQSAPEPAVAPATPEPAAPEAAPAANAVESPRSIRWE
jgi:hypothetical protein